MALRNLERQRFRTVTKLVVLFVGIFAIALVLIFGFNLRKQIQMLELLSYNLVIRVPQKDVETVLQKTKLLNGINQQTLQHRPTITVKMLRLSGTYPTGTRSYSNTQQPQNYSNAVLEGFDLAHNLLPDASWVRLLKGRMLQPQDVHTHNVLLVSPNTQQALIGVTITLKSQDGRQSLSATVVGIVSPQPHVPLQSTLLASQEMITQLNHSDQYTQTFYLSVDPARSDETISTLAQTAPDIVFIMNTVSLVNIEQRFFNAAVAVLLALGSFAILAALAIIANTVALAMIERRREIGILKAVGYPSKQILEIVLLENILIATIAAMMALILITLTLNLFTNVYKFAAGFVVPWYLLLGIILGTVGIVGLMVFMVVSGINKMRPLDVLRYE
jgi:ABC-type antimicrobial peptide transport system permease subunit